MPCQDSRDFYEKVRHADYFIDHEGDKWKRQLRFHGSHAQGEPVHIVLLEERNPFLLTLVLQKQTPGEPMHWSLFVAREGKAGCVYQVKGDATAMHHAFTTNVDLFSPYTYDRAYILAELHDGGNDIVKQLAYLEAPPQADSQAFVTENYQG